MTIIFFDITGIKIEPYRLKKDIQTDIVDYIKPRTTIKLSRKKIIFVQKLNTPGLVHCFNFLSFSVLASVVLGLNELLRH